MIRRIITGLILSPLAIGAIYWGDIPLLAAILTLAILTAQELFEMLIRQGRNPFTWMGYVGVALIIALAFSVEWRWLWSTTWMTLIMLSLLLAMSYEVITKRLWFPKSDIISTIRVVGVVGLMFSSFIILRQADNGFFWLLFCVLLTWGSDTFALFGGKWMGRTPLAPSISPNKTIEGSVFGILGSISIAAVFVYILHLPLLYLVIAGFISIIGQLGDLHESLTKRFFNVKDSSQLLPGHGGIYDRADSLLFVMPAILYLVVL